MPTSSDQGQPQLTDIGAQLAEILAKLGNQEDRIRAQEARDQDPEEGRGPSTSGRGGISAGARSLGFGGEGTADARSRRGTAAARDDQGVGIGGRPLSNLGEVDLGRGRFDLEPRQLSSLKSAVPKFDGSETKYPLYKSEFEEFAMQVGCQAALYTTDDMLVGGRSFNVELLLDKGVFGTRDSNCKDCMDLFGSKHYQAPTSH